ncbi:single-stranded DNA-binding protein [Dyadobacter luteus]|nr:single-stranded DNA-binding protein [Dyadobacter luteus]
MEITGRITQDASTFTTKSDKQVVNFNIAVNERYQTKAGEKKEITEYIRCSYWIAPAVAAVLTKGTIVQLFGRISTQAWQDSDGNPKASLQFHTSNIKILGGGSRGSFPKPELAGNEKQQTRQQGDDLPF